MSRRNKDSDVVFSSEKFESRRRMLRILIPAAAVVLVAVIAIVAAFIIRDSKGVKYTGGEDTPYPYSWRNSRKGVMTLEIARDADPEKTWQLVNPSNIEKDAEEAKKQPKETARFTITPKETGRSSLILVLMEGEEAAVRIDMLLETTVSEKGTLTTDVISSSLMERQTTQRGGEESFFPYSFRTGTDGFLVVTITNNTEVAVEDWECVSENENAVQIGGIFFTGSGSGMEVYLASGMEVGTSRVIISSELASAQITLEVERTAPGSLLVRTHSMEGGTTAPAAEPEPDEEIVLPEPAETDETLTEEQRLQLELQRLQTESEQSPSD